MCDSLDAVDDLRGSEGTIDTFVSLTPEGLGDIGILESTTFLRVHTWDRHAE